MSTYHILYNRLSRSDTGELEGYLGGEHYIDLDVLNRGITLDDITIGGSQNR
jgi:hypothetical protein